MPFLVITGEFVPGAGNPDGDSIRFKPDTPDLLYRLRRRGRPHKLSAATQTVQLRFEGIDTMEKAANPQFSASATGHNLALCGVPGGSGTARGYICSNQLGPNGRPIAFVYAGDAPPKPNGEEVFLDASHMASSVNGQQLEAGHAYPLFYDTLFYDLRNALVDLMKAAQSGNKGVWAADASQSGARYSGRDSLKTMPPLFPKLWRRLDTYARDRDVSDPTSLDEFEDYLEFNRPDRVLVLDKAWQTGFDSVVRVSGDKVMLTEPAENLVFAS